MRPDSFRIFGWLIPILCIAGAGYAIFSQSQKLTAANEARDQANRDVEAAAAEKAAVESSPVETRFAAADSTPMEETLFVMDLRQRAQRAGAVISEWKNSAMVYGEGNQSGETDKETVKLLEGIRRISSTLTVSGSYGALRSFVGDLTLSDRLFTVNDIKWTRTDEGTSLTVTLSRYVAPPKKLVASTASPPVQGAPVN